MITGRISTRHLELMSPVPTWWLVPSCHCWRRVTSRKLPTCELPSSIITIYNTGLMINISSTTLGSIGMAPRYAIFPVPAYKVSKAALNMLTVQYAQSFADQGFTFLTISPGVSTIFSITFSIRLALAKPLLIVGQNQSWRWRCWSDSWPEL